MAGLFDDLIPGAKPGAAGGGMFGDLIPAKPKPAGFLRSVADLGIEAASGVARGVKATADAFGADNAVSRGADTVDKFAREYLSAAAKADDQRVSDIMAAAQDAGVWEQVKAAAEAFTVKPAGMIANALGTSVPTIATALIPGVGQAGVAARLGALGAMGAAQGAGAVKGSIYEAVKAEQIKAGASEAEAEAAAVKAQEYGGANTANIAGGAALGAAASATGVQPVIAKMLQRSEQVAAEIGKRGMIDRALNPDGLLARTGMGALKETPLEAAQGGQEQYASNIALQNEGFDTPAFRGVAGAAALEGLASAGPGAAFAALDKPKIAKVLGAPTVDDAIKKAEQVLALPAPASGVADELVDGVIALPGPNRPATPPVLRALPAPDGGTVYMVDEAGNAAPQPAAARAEAYNRAVEADIAATRRRLTERQRQTDLGMTPGLRKAQETREDGNLQREPIPVGEATEVLPTGEVEEFDAIPTADATEFDAVPAGEAAELDVETIQPTDLKAKDGEPFVSKTGAQARAFASGGGKVVTVPDHFGSGIPGYVVRPLVQARPNNTRGTNADDIARADGQRLADGGRRERAVVLPDGGPGDVLASPASTAGQGVDGAGVAGSGAARTNALTVQKGLTVSFGGKSYPVKSINDAQEKWVRFRDSADGGMAAGVSQVGNGVRITDSDGKFVARISYNGRAWDSEDVDSARVLAEAPDGRKMPQQVLDDEAAGKSRPDTSSRYLPPKETLEEVTARSTKARDDLARTVDAPTLTEGQRVTLNGTPYTVTFANNTAVKLQGADGGTKMVATNSRTFQAIQREPNEAARPQAQAAAGETNTPAAAPAPAAPAVVPRATGTGVEADGLDADSSPEERAMRSGDFKEMLRLRNERQQRDVKAVGDMSQGGVLRHEGGKRYVLVLPDVDGGGKWRIQRFDKDGFSGHEVFNDQAEATQAAINEGFKTRDDGALDAMQATPAWDRGMAAADIIRRVNGKEISFAEGNRLLAEDDAKQKPAAKDDLPVKFKSTDGTRSDYGVYVRRVGQEVRVSLDTKTGEFSGINADITAAEKDDAKASVRRFIRKEAEDQIKWFESKGMEVPADLRKAATPNATAPVEAPSTGGAGVPAAVAPSELPRLPVEAYRVERRYANGAVIRPLPGKAFTDGEVQQIAGWFRAAKWEVSTAAPSGVSAVNNANMSADDIPEPYTAAQRKKDERQREADTATAAKTAAQDDYLTGTAAGKYVAATFGDALNKFNSVALAKFLAGDADTFAGLMNARAADVVQGMGIAVEGRATKDVLADLKARFAGQSAPAPERTPKAQAVKEALAPDLTTRKGMVKALKKLGYDATDLDAARTRIPNWGRVGVKLNTIPFKLDMVVELKNERWQFSALESEDPQSISQQEEIAKFKADLAKLIEGPNKAAAPKPTQGIAELPPARFERPAAPATLAPATHKDPGEPAEPVTPAVVREAIKTAADNRDRPIKDVKADALRLIDAAMPNAKPADDMDVQMYEATAPGVKMTAAQQAEYKRLSGNARDKYMERLANELAAQHQRAADNIGYVTIKVPGDGVFKVLNTAARLAEFRKKVEASSGFKDRQPRPAPEDAGDGIQRGSGSKLAAFSNMVEDGDIQAALDYAEAVGIDPKTAKLSDVLRRKLDMLMTEGVTRTADEAPAAAPAPQPVAEPAADDRVLTIELGGSTQTLTLPKPAWQVTDDELVQAVKGSGTYLGKPGSKYDPYRQWREAHSEAITKAARDGKTFPDELLYDKPALIRTDLNDDQADEASDAMVAEYRATKDYGKAVAVYREWGKTPALDLKGFTRTSRGNGAFDLSDGNMRVSVEPTGRDKFQARFGSAKSSPYLQGEQGAVDWAEQYRKDATPAPAAAPTVPAAMTGPRRDPTLVTMFNPYINGDIVTIGGKDWMVKQDTPGWYLSSDGTWRGEHPTIKGIKGMQDLIREVEQAAQESIPAPATQAAPAPAPAAAEPAPLTLTAIPKTLQITLELEGEDGKTQKKLVNARKAFLAATQRVEKLRALKECVG